MTSSAGRSGGGNSVALAKKKSGEVFSHVTELIASHLLSYLSSLGMVGHRLTHHVHSAVYAAPAKQNGKVNRG
jgi:hypothetical protein